MRIYLLVLFQHWGCSSEGRTDIAADDTTISSGNGSETDGLSIDSSRLASSENSDGGSVQNIKSLDDLFNMFMSLNINEDSKTLFSRLTVPETFSVKYDGVAWSAIRDVSIELVRIFGTPKILSSETRFGEVVLDVQDWIIFGFVSHKSETTEDSHLFVRALQVLLEEPFMQQDITPPERLLAPPANSDPNEIDRRSITTQSTADLRRLSAAIRNGVLLDFVHAILDLIIRESFGLGIEAPPSYSQEALGRINDWGQIPIAERSQFEYGEPPEDVRAVHRDMIEIVESTTVERRYRTTENIVDEYLIIVRNLSAPIVHALLQFEYIPSSWKNFMKDFVQHGKFCSSNGISPGHSLTRFWQLLNDRANLRRIPNFTKLQNKVKKIFTTHIPRPSITW